MEPNRREGFHPTTVILGSVVEPESFWLAPSSPSQPRARVAGQVPDVDAPMDDGPSESEEQDEPSQFILLVRRLRTGSLGK